MKIRGHIALKDRKMLTLGDFRGVDLSSSRLRVSPSRATLCENFICEYGVNRKRHGWRELFRIKGDGMGQPMIYGIFPFENDMIVYAGKRFYRVTKGSDGSYGATDVTLTSTHELSRVDPKRLDGSRRIQAFYCKGRLYLIGCGDYLVYGSWNEGESYELRRVVDGEDTYIPKTTINIDADGTENDTRASLDDLNLLCSRRKNGLVGNAKSKWWTLDASIDEGTEVRVEVELADGDTTKTLTYLSDSEGKLVDKEGTAVGTVDYAKGKIALTVSTKPPIENRDNITVIFTHAAEGYAERITKCQFGTLFGVGGNTDRLFLSGNPDLPNIDFWSAMDDYTYFSDLDYAAMGTDASAIGGYGRLTDGTLVIYKENAEREASIFYRTGGYKTYNNADGSLDEQRAVFPTYAGAAGEVLASRYAAVNFGGDALMLSPNGVFGIVLSDNVSTVERNTRERSRLINEKLKRMSKEDLANAVGIVHGGRYYLAVNGICFVADSRYKYVAEDAQDNAFNYEWWYYTNVPAWVWAVVDGTLCFGTTDGRVCAFDNEYTDRTYDESEAGDLGIDISRGGMIVREGMPFEIVDGDELTFKTDGIYALYEDEVTVEDGKVTVSEERIGSIFEGVEVYADEVGVSGLSAHCCYKITDVDRGGCQFSLADEQGNTVTLLSGGFRLHRLLSGRTLFVRERQGSFFRLAERKDGEALILTQYDGALPTTPIAFFTHRKNVVARWYTPVFDLGTSEALKTLLKMTIVTEPEVNGNLSFGYETRRKRQMMEAKGLSEFSFEDFSFKNFAFDTEFATSYTVKVNERNFNFVTFRFVSDTDRDCAVNSFTVTYKINKTNTGVN